MMHWNVLHGTTKTSIIKLDFGGKNIIRWRIIMANIWDDLKKNLVNVMRNGWLQTFSSEDG